MSPRKRADTSYGSRLSTKPRALDRDAARAAGLRVLGFAHAPAPSSLASARARAAHCAMPADSRQRFERRAHSPSASRSDSQACARLGAEFLPGHAPLLPPEARLSSARSGCFDRRVQARDFAPTDTGIAGSSRRASSSSVSNWRLEQLIPKNSAARSGQLVRLIEDQRIDARQQLAVPVLLERQVGQQQVVIDDHEVGLERRAPRREHVAARELRAARAGAGFARAGELGAQRMRLAERRHFGQIATARRARPVAQLRAAVAGSSLGSSDCCASASPSFARHR